MLKQKNINFAKTKEYSLVLAYFVCLFITTCFFFDAHKVEVLGYTIQLPIALTFFPLTFAISNIIQDKFGKVAATSLTFLAFTFDTLLVFGAVFLASIGDRSDYWTVFKDMPTIMVSTWLFMGVGSTVNILFYGYINKKPAKSTAIAMLRLFSAITLAEIITSSMSMPLLFYKHGLEGSLILTITISVAYKVLANIVITIVYGILIKKNNFTSIKSH
ncbi:VUT family protein [Rickettsiales bacterium LUAb2]